MGLMRATAGKSQLKAASKRFRWSDESAPTRSAMRARWIGCISSGTMKLCSNIPPSPADNFNGEPFWPATGPITTGATQIYGLLDELTGMIESIATTAVMAHSGLQWSGEGHTRSWVEQ